MNTNAPTKQKNSKAAANIAGLINRQNKDIIKQENSTPPFPEKIPIFIDYQSMDMVQENLYEILELHWKHFGNKPFA
jgi:hypothetical protein